MFISAVILLVSAGAPKSQEQLLDPATDEILISIGSRVRLSVEHVTEGAKKPAGRRSPRARIKTNHYTGTVSKFQNDTVSITVGVTKMDFHIHSISKFEIRDGTRPAILKGAVRGLGIGAGVGLVIGLVGCSAGGGGKSPGSINFELVSDGECRALSTFAGAPLGLVVGTIVGVASRQDKWKRIDISRLKFAFEPMQQNAFGLKLTLAL